MRCYHAFLLENDETLYQFFSYFRRESCMVLKEELCYLIREASCMLRIAVRNLKVRMIFWKAIVLEQ